MRSVVSILVFTIIMCAVCSISSTSNHVYQSEWAVHFENGKAPDVLNSEEYVNLGAIASLQDWYLVRHKPTHEHNTRARAMPVVPNTRVTASLKSHPDVSRCEQQRAEPLAHQVVQFSDPMFESQWHLDNTGQFAGTPGVDANIVAAWNLGFSGNGVRIAFVDDGLQYDHPDLAEAYQADSSIDINDNDSDPYPDVTADPHGTSVAGVAGARNNSVCGVGSAYFAELAAIRLTAAPTTDAQRATALSYKYDLNDIFSSSFGPVDTGKSVGGRGTLTAAAMKDGVTNGRNGKGTIYVFAAGNGGQGGSNCNYNGFANAMEVVAVGALGNDGTKAIYGELCAAMLVSAPSGNLVDATAGIRTTDIMGANGYDPTDCTSTFDGTSSACPLVSGIIALMLEANPALTWRDVQHILAHTAAMTDDTDSDWVKNGAGLHVNHKYGFGRVDATAAVNAALAHQLLPAQIVDTRQVSPNQVIPDFPNTEGVTASVTIGDDFPVERVVVTVFINHNASGDLQVKLVSPSGTESYLAYPHADYPTVLIQGVAQPIAVGGSDFGPALPFNATQYYETVKASPANTCESPSNCQDLKGALAIISISASCTIYQQVKLMQDCGAAGVLVISSVDAVVQIALPSGSDASAITIPNVQLPSSVGNNLTASVALQQGKYFANDYQGWQFTSVRSWGESSKGTWSLTVTDGFANDVGTFYSAQFDVYGAHSANATISDPPGPPPMPSSTSSHSSLDPEESFPSAGSHTAFSYMALIAFVFLILA